MAPELVWAATSLSLVTQLVEDGFGLPEVGGVEAFGKPVVKFREHRARLIATAAIAQWAGEAGRRT